jgi:hypothetical protein
MGNKKCEIKEYIKVLPITEKHKKYINDKHNEIFDYAKSTKKFVEKKPGILVAYKHRLDKATEDIVNINNKFGSKVVALKSGVLGQTLQINAISASTDFNDIRTDAYYKYDTQLKEQEEAGLDYGEGTLFQLPDSQVKAEAIKDLDDYLLKFLEPFHFQSKEIDNMKEKFGLDALGVTDLLNKVIYYTRESDRNVETIPEEVGHAIVMLAGKNNTIVKDLLENIESWSEYKNIKKQYLKKYNNNENKVKVEAVGKLIAKSLVKTYKNNTEHRSLLKKLIDYIVNRFIKTNSSLFLADTLAVEILKGNTSYIGNLIPSNEKLNYEEAIKDNKLAQDIIKEFTNTNNYLVGSLAIAGQGDTIYRNSKDPIHDLDFINDSSTPEKRKTISDSLSKMNAVAIHYGWANESKKYTTYSYYIPAEGYYINVTDRDKKTVNNAGGWVSEFELLDKKTNKLVFTARSFWQKNKNGKNEKQMYYILEDPTTKPNSLYIPVDFFTYEEGFNETTSGIFSSSSDIYLGKLGLSPLGINEVMFDRDKDQQDYVLHNPMDRSLPSNKNMLYYQIADKVNVITANDKVVFGHPGIGKTYLKESGRTDVIDFDSDYKSRINEKFNLPKGFKARNDFQKSNKEKYQQAIRELWNQAKQEAKETGKQLFASDMILLREFANDFDKVITMSKETFIERSKQRNDYTPGSEGTEGWKNNLDIEISKIDKSKVINTNKYLSDLLLPAQVTKDTNIDMSNEEQMLLVKAFDNNQINKKDC